MDDKRELYAADLSTATWRTSTYTGNNGQCVEIAELPGGAVAIRDSKSPHREALRFTAAEWAAFLSGVHAGEFG
jgi:Domain of unknown function (DUF397)